ncbi:MAG: hypothetical protein G01um101477_114 [Candidatus Doudnabacteria bacterium Gr01-1014_77]|uniref:Uncharacterized protein n=1 Tax=Candidatus Doudnabacteria bacterium Gr01-1014_77 TaxID=2017133 RepID=A0A554JDF2_9BACT|nr:MAG: hypothetical protein G01um101477_114 [Candidatus Doudnabacteria bacterium Gr01-1014_77]
MFRNKKITPFFINRRFRVLISTNHKLIFGLWRVTELCKVQSRITFKACTPVLVLDLHEAGSRSGRVVALDGSPLSFIGTNHETFEVPAFSGTIFSLHTIDNDRAVEVVSIEVVSLFVPFNATEDDGRTVVRYAAPVEESNHKVELRGTTGDAEFTSHAILLDLSLVNGRPAPPYLVAQATYPCRQELLIECHNSYEMSSYKNSFLVNKYKIRSIFLKPFLHRKQQLDEFHILDHPVLPL